MGSSQPTISGQPGSVRTTEAQLTIAARFQRAIDALAERLFAPIDIASIVVFRIAFGVVMLWEMNRYISHGWIDSIYLETQYRFSYAFFGWVQPWPGNWLHVHFHILAALAAMIALGLFYRVATILFFLGFAYVFLLDKGNYLNHLYLATLISFLMMFVPANRLVSVDAWRKPQIRSNTAPTWALLLLASQIAAIYVFGGIAKLNGDWLRGRPMDRWLPNSNDVPVIGRWFDESWTPYFFSYGGLLIDLFIVPLILWRRTRWYAVIVLILFHRFNAEIFTIGIFPSFATAAIILLLPPDLPRKVLGALRPAHTGTRSTSRSRTDDYADPAPGVPFLRRPMVQRVTLALVVGYIALQVLVPLRFLLYPGNPGWTDQGDRFAWRMMLHSKVGEISYELTDPATGQTWTVDPNDYLTDLQVGYLVGQPDMILQFSHFLADEWGEKGFPDVEVRANSVVSFNSRPAVPIVDSSVDLAAEELTIGNASWITSLDEQQELWEAENTESESAS